MSFVIEETLTNSYMRDSEGNPVNETLFTVVSWQGRNFLYKGIFDEVNWQDNRIAKCINGNYREKYGDMRGWLHHIRKRELKNADSLRSQIKDLRGNLDITQDLIRSIDYARVK